MHTAPLDPQKLASYRAAVERAQHPDPAARLFPIYGWCDVRDLLVAYDQQVQRADAAERKRDEMEIEIAQLRARAAVTKAHVQRWLMANGWKQTDWTWWRSGEHEIMLYAPHAAITKLAEITGRAYLDILDEMAAMEVSS